jgi:hypothetical protein
MGNAGTITMARPKSRPKTKGPATPQVPRATIINLKGSQEQADWLEAIHRKTHLAKAVIVRLALDQWAGSNGHPPMPSAEGDE